LNISSDNAPIDIKENPTQTLLPKKPNSKMRIKISGAVIR